MVPFCGKIYFYLHSFESSVFEVRSGEPLFNWQDGISIFSEEYLPLYFKKAFERGKKALKLKVASSLKLEQINLL